MNIFILFLFFLIMPMYASVRQAFTCYKNHDYVQAQQNIESLLVNDPHNAQLNYNAGLVYYQQGAYDDAQGSFNRVIAATDVVPDMKKHAQFNLGNSYYKQTLDFLGDDWEQKKVDAHVLDKSLESIELSIDSFEKTLLHDESNNSAMVNKEHAEQLQEKIKQKKEQQKQQENQDKQDKQDKQDTNDKQDQDQQEQQDSSDKHNQDKQDKQDTNDKQDQDQQEQQDNSDKQDQDKQDQQDTNDKQDQDQQEQQDNSDKQDQDKQDQQNTNDKQDQDKLQDESETKKTPQDQEDKSQPQEGPKQDMEMRAMQAVLDDLSKKEENLQKALIRLKTQGGHSRPGQHNW